MVRLSKRKINDNILFEVYRLFFEVISRSHNKETFLEVIDNVLSPTEKIMVAKRIAIIYLLIKGVNQRAIAYILKVSIATVSKYALLFNQGNTKLVEIIKTMITKEKTLDFMHDAFATVFIQPGMKIGHWDLYSKIKKEQLRKKTYGL